MNNNLKALIKLANAFDLYDHQHYGYRHNANNPIRKDIKIFKEYLNKDKDKVVEAETTQIVPGLPKWPQNKNAPQWSKEQTHIFKRKRSINGTGGGPAYGVEHRNPFNP